MCAHAKDLGIECKPYQDWCALPILPDARLKDYYDHINEYCGKIKADLKASRCWPVVDKIPNNGLPGTGIQEKNMVAVKMFLGHHNDAFNRMPDGTQFMWRKFVGHIEFTNTANLGVLYDIKTLDWGTPTWCACVDSDPETGTALLVNKQYCYKHNTRVSTSTCVAIIVNPASSSSSSSPSSCYLTPIPSLEHVVHVVLILFILLLQPPLQLPLLQPLLAYCKQARQQSAP